MCYKGIRSVEFQKVDKKGLTLRVLVLDASVGFCSPSRVASPTMLMMNISRSVRFTF